MTQKKYDKQYEELFNKALKLRDEGHFDEACRMLTELIEKYPDIHIAYIMKGGILLYEQKKYQEALVCFAKAVEIKPKSEFASLGVFHSLWDMERYQEAVDEIRRFGSITDLFEDYTEIIDELLEEELIDEDLNWLE